MKDIYEMLNDIDTNEKEFESASVNEIERIRIKINLKKAIGHKKMMIRKKVSIAAAITFICIASLIAVKPTLATNIPIINQLFKKDLINVNKQYADYMDTIGITKSCKGIDVTFESAVADDNIIFLNYIVKNNNKEIIDNSNDAFLKPTSLKVNGKVLNTSAGASSEFIDNNTIRIIKKIDWSKYKVPNKINVDITISQLFGKSGNWGVRFFLDKSKQAEKTIEKKVNLKLDINGVKGKIETVTISPLSLMIKGTGFEKLYNDVDLEFIVLDDKGKILHWGGSGREKQGIFDSYKWNSAFTSNEAMKSVTIIPIYKKLEDKSIKKLSAVNLDINNNKPIELTIDKYKSVNIKDYFVDGEYLIVRYNQKYFGKDSFVRVLDIPIYVTADGKEVKVAADTKADKLYSKYSDLNENVRAFKVGTATKLMVGTYDGLDVKILKDKSFTVTTKK